MKDYGTWAAQGWKKDEKGKYPAQPYATAEGVYPTCHDPVKVALKQSRELRECDKIRIRAWA